jgi:hypothetical protein
MNNNNNNNNIDKNINTICVNYFANCMTPKSLGKLTIEEVLHKIKYGDENLMNVKTARKFGKRHIQYNKIKTTVLPTFRFNFLYKDYAKDENVIGATGLIFGGSGLKFIAIDLLCFEDTASNQSGTR